MFFGQNRKSTGPAMQKALEDESLTMERLDDAVMHHSGIKSKSWTSG